jgi:hypothetical protein
MSTVALFVIQGTASISRLFCVSTYPTIGILVLRVLYMFSHSNLARAIISITYLGAIVSTIAILILLLNGRPLLTPLSTLAEHVDLVGCPVHVMTRFWHLYLPAFTLHTVLYIFTLIRVLNCENSPQALLIRRLHREYV